MIHLLGPESPVVAYGKCVNSEGIQNYRRVQEILFKTLKPNIESFKPH